MTTGEKLKEIMRRCRCGVHLSVNDHRDIYQTVRKTLDDLACCNNDEPVVEPDVLAVMVARDTIVDLQFYPDTPVGSYSIYHYDLDAALDRAIDILKDPSMGHHP